MDGSLNCDFYYTSGPKNIHPCLVFTYLLYPRGPFDVTTSVSDLAMPAPPPGCPVRSPPDAGFEPASADHNFLALLKALFCCC